MVLKIRLRQQGRTNRQTYRFVVTDVRNPRDGKYLEMVGWYNPFAKVEQEAAVDIERIQYWVGQGAQVTPSAQTILLRIAPAFMKEFRANLSEKRVKQAARRRALKKKA
jgi:small subunit ribosomal protein S16